VEQEGEALGDLATRELAIKELGEVFFVLFPPRGIEQ
jgi:hypothetical protein